MDDIITLWRQVDWCPWCWLWKKQARVRWKLLWKSVSPFLQDWLPNRFNDLYSHGHFYLTNARINTELSRLLACYRFYVANWAILEQPACNWCSRTYHHFHILCNASLLIVDVHCVISTHLTAHFFWGVALSTIPLLLDTLWEAYTQDQHWRPWLLATLSQPAFGLCSCISCRLTQRVRESTGSWTLQLHIANLHQLTLRGPDLRTGHVHKLQLKQRFTPQLHHFAELSYCK